MIEVRPVRTKRDRDRFLLLPWRIYRDDPLWVPPLLRQTRARIDPRRGVFFERGEAEFFLAWRGSQVVGRICAGEDKVTNAQRSSSDCLFGFFETVNEVEVAQALFDRAAAWGNARGLNKLVGPYNLDYEDSYGVLVDGRERPAAVLCGHTPAYYQSLLEGAGFTKARADALAYLIPIDPDSISGRRLEKVANYLKLRRRITVRGADLENWQQEVDRVYSLINRALAHLSNFIPWQRSALEHTAAGFLKLADPDLILFAEVDGETVGWFPGVPDINETLVHSNGLRFPWDALRAWWHSRQPPQTLAIKSVLVLPEYWDAGVPGMLFSEMNRRAARKGYRWADLSLTSEDNPTTSLLAPRMGARIYKRYRVYGRQI